MNKLIVIEGLDLTGKTTVATKLNHKLRKKHTSNYNRGEVNKNLERRIQLPNPNERELELLYLLLAMTDNHKIDTDYLIQDRSYPSILFYSAMKKINIASNIPVTCFPQPSHFVHLVCSYEEKCRRYETREKNNQEDLKLISSKQYHDECQQLYNTIMEKIHTQYGNVLTLDTEKLDLKTIIKKIVVNL